MKTRYRHPATRAFGSKGQPEPTDLGPGSTSSLCQDNPSRNPLANIWPIFVVRFSRHRLCGLTPEMGSSTFGEDQREYDGRLDCQRGGPTWKMHRRKPPSSARWRSSCSNRKYEKTPRGSETCSPMNLLNSGVRAEPSTNVRSLIGYRKSSGIQKRNPRSGQLPSSRHDGLRLRLRW